MVYGTAKPPTYGIHHAAHCGINITDVN